MKPSRLTVQAAGIHQSPDKIHEKGGDRYITAFHAINYVLMARQAK